MSGARASGRSAATRSGANPRSRAEKATHYRHYADQFRALSEGEQNRARRAQLAKLARHYTELARGQTRL
jgi:hypothetical protein